MVLFKLHLNKREGERERPTDAHTSSFKKGKLILIITNCTDKPHDMTHYKSEENWYAHTHSKFGWALDINACIFHLW